MKISLSGAFVWFLLLALTVATPPNLPAQSFNGTVNGTVTDATGGVLAQAKVTLINERTNESRTQNTGENGAYTFPEVAPGIYRVEAEAQGFKKFVRPHVAVDIQQQAVVDAHMEIGAVTESVEVTGAMPQLQTTTSALGQVVSNEQITELPLVGRNTLSLIGLTAGAQPMGAFGGIPARTNAYNQGFFSTSGSQVVTNESLIDGAPANTALYNAPAYVPVVDAVEEFKVQTNTFSAEFGRTGGGIINIVTKSGSNQLHGSLYEFFRNNHLDANNWFNNRAGLALPAYTTNQFGFTAGGPVEIPHVYNGKDKTFWFFNYEGLRDSKANTVTWTIPTQAQLKGNFAGGPVIYDPTSSTLDPSSGAYLRTPIPGNIIPSSLINKVSAKIAAIWPAPNATGTASGANNFVATGAVKNVWDSFMARIDHNFGQKTRLFGRVSYSEAQRGAYDYFHFDFAGGVNPGGGDVPLNFNARNAMLDFTQTFSSTFLFEFRYGFVRQHLDKVPPGWGLDYTTLGLPAALNQQLPVAALPAIAVSGFNGIAPNSSDLIARNDNTHSWQGAFTKMFSNHQLKFGADFRFIPIGELQPSSPEPSFSFNSSFTSGPNALTGTGGNAVASFLLGYPVSGSVDNTPAISISYRYFGSYVQDDYRVSSKLTLNLGVRWEVETGRNERYNRLSWFDPSVANPVASQLGLPNLLGGLEFPGVNGNTTRQKVTNYHNLGPRFGFAYNALSKTVIRGGYGLFYLPSTGDDQGTNLGASGFFVSTTFNSSLNGGITPADNLGNPFPNGINQPTGSSLGLKTLIGQDLVSVYHQDRSAYAQEWNLDVQQQFAGNILLDAAYAGNKGTALPIDIQADQLNDRFLALGSALLTQVPNPLFGVVTTGPLSSATVAAGQLLRPFPEYDSVNIRAVREGDSIYHALQLKLERRFSAGLSLLAAYTFSKTITDAGSRLSINFANPGVQDSNNLRGERALANFDTPQRFILSYNWELPFGPGKSLLNRGAKVLGMIAGGWQLNGVTTYQNGQPLGLTTSVNNTHSLGGGSRPNDNGTSAKLSGATESRLNEYFNTAVFSAPPAFTFGNTARTLPDVFAPGLHNWDFSIMKNNRFKEHYNVQFRAEFFNGFNMVNFGAPGTTQGTSSFGVISSAADGRVIQFGLKVLF
jgi:Carboxypeptidase regulatory-like domain